MTMNDAQAHRDQGEYSPRRLSDQAPIRTTARPRPPMTADNPDSRTDAQAHSHTLQSLMPPGLDARLDEVEELRWQCPHCDDWNTGRVINAAGTACPSCLAPVDEAADTQVLTDASTPTPAKRCGITIDTQDEDAFLVDLGGDDDE